MLLLQGIILETLNPDVVVSVAPRLLPLLSPDWEPNHSDGARNIDSGAISTSFIYRTRLKLSLALFILNRPSLPNDLALRFRTAHDELLDLSMALHIYKTAGKVLEETVDDQLAVLRFMHAAQHYPVPQSIHDQFSEIKLKVQEYMQEHIPSQQLLDPANNPRPVLGLLYAVDIDEKCPACDLVVLFQNLTYGRCRAGHVWGMFSVFARTHNLR
ncbi:hypothetical protein FRC09_020685 [Ceratobasidium sp. 395]|nr:hypothetical protein FRC09_020685 [Ceratobasidium sp. 395]